MKHASCVFSSFFFFLPLPRSSFTLGHPSSSPRISRVTQASSSRKAVLERGRGGEEGEWNGGGGAFLYARWHATSKSPNKKVFNCSKKVFIEFRNLSYGLTKKWYEQFCVIVRCLLSAQDFSQSPLRFIMRQRSERWVRQDSGRGIAGRGVTLCTRGLHGDDSEYAYGGGGGGGGSRDGSRGRIKRAWRARTWRDTHRWTKKRYIWAVRCWEGNVRAVCSVPKRWMQRGIPAAGGFFSSPRFGVQKKASETTET